MEIADLISNLGFPIAVAIGLLFYVKNINEKTSTQFDKLYEQQRADSKEREEHYREHQKEMVHEMGKISLTIDRINDRLEAIEEKVYVDK